MVEAERAFTTIHPGAIYLHLGRSYEVERARHRARAGRSSAASTATGTRGRRRRPRSTSSGSASSAQVARGRAPLRRGLGHRAGDRLPAGLDLRAGADRHRRPRAARAELRHPGALVRAAATGSAAALPPRRPARRPARDRARPDRGAAADRDVRPLGHRRPLDQRPLPDRPLDDLHLRRPPRRGRDHPARLRAVRAPARRRRAADRASAPASPAAPPACRARSAATSTNPCTRRARWS